MMQHFIQMPPIHGLTAGRAGVIVHAGPWLHVQAIPQLNLVNLFCSVSHVVL